MATRFGHTKKPEEILFLYFRLDIFSHLHNSKSVCVMKGIRSCATAEKNQSLKAGNRAKKNKSLERA